MIVIQKNTALHFLLGNDPVLYNVSNGARDIDAAAMVMECMFPRLRPAFDGRIQYVSRELMGTYQKGGPKLRDTLDDMSVDQAGTLILPLAPWMNCTIFYQLRTVRDGMGERRLNGTIISFGSWWMIKKPMLVQLIAHTGDAYWAYDEAALTRNGGSAREWMDAVARVVKLTNSYALERRQVAPGGQLDVGGRKYANGTAWPVEVLDSKWLKGVVTSRAFSKGWCFAMKGDRLVWRREGA